MSECQFIKECQFFKKKLGKMPAASDVIRKMYCQWRFTTCARYKIATTLGQSAVPHDMFPGDKLKAAEMLIHYDIK